MFGIRTDEYGEILGVLGLIFIEIRASEKLLKAHILADIFHNVPSAINNGRSAEEITAEINRKSAHHRCEEIISDYFTSVREFAQRV